MKTIKYLFFFVVFASLYIVPANVAQASVPLAVHDDGKVLQVMIFRGQNVGQLEAEINEWLRTSTAIYSIVSIITSESAKAGDNNGNYYSRELFSITVIYYKKT